MCAILNRAPIHQRSMDGSLWSQLSLPSSFMPTRTINVGDADREPFLEVHTRTRDLTIVDRSDDWATLSHRWGGSSPLTTTTHTLNEHYRAIPLTSMPKTFRDAVIITRQLQIRRLWIDSLCIIQDSKEDWERESARMAEVYRHGLINIAATTSRHADDGILKPRPKRYKVTGTTTAQVRKKKRGGVKTRIWVYWYSNLVLDSHKLRSNDTAWRT